MEIKADRKSFLEQLRLRLPAVLDEVDSAEAGLLHCEMGAFLRFTEAAIDRRDEPTISACFCVANWAFVRGDAALVNAVQASYLYGLSLEGKREYAIGLMPDELREELLRIRCEPPRVSRGLD